MGLSDEMYNPSVQVGGLEDGEIVYCMILEETPSMTGLKEHEAEQDKLEKEAKAMGEDYEREEAKLHEVGIGYTLAVIGRHVAVGDMPEEDEVEMTIATDDDGNMTLPNYFISCHFQQLVPEHLLTARSKKGYPIGDLMSVGFQRMAKGRPLAGKLFPSCAEARDFNSKTNVSEIPKGREDEYRDLLDKEKQRLDLWNKVITFYDSHSDDQKVQILREIVAKRLFLMYINEEEVDSFTFIEPKPGIVFRAMVEKFGNFPTFNIKGTGKWDGNMFPIYSHYKVVEPTEEQIEDAAKILELVNEAKAKK